MRTDVIVSSTLNRVVTTLTELSKYQTTLIEQIHKTLSRNLSNFTKRSLIPLKDTKKHFDKISDDLDNVLNRNSQVSRSKMQENEEITNLLTATRSCFQHTALDYVSQLSCVQSKKRHEIMEAVRIVFKECDTV